MPKVGYAGENVSATAKHQGKIGTYTEAAGGGDVIKKGDKFQVADSVEEAEQIRKQNPKTKVRINQPRDENGQFTYNSANARELKYGPSRGSTVPPFLRGIKLTFAVKTGQKINLDGRVYNVTKDINADDFIDMFKRYHADGKGFGDSVMKSSDFLQSHKGRLSRSEKARVTKGVQGVWGSKNNPIANGFIIKTGRAKAALVDASRTKVVSKGDAQEFLEQFTQFNQQAYEKTGLPLWKTAAAPAPKATPRPAAATTTAPRTSPVQPAQPAPQQQPVSAPTQPKQTAGTQTTTGLHRTVGGNIQNTASSVLNNRAAGVMGKLKNIVAKKQQNTSPKNTINRSISGISLSDDEIADLLK